MKIATVTWITYNNYGTLLQAYALQTTIKGKGYENAILWDQTALDLKRKSTNTIVPYKPTNVIEWYYEKKKSFKRWAMKTHRQFKQKAFLSSQKRMDQFRANNLIVDYDVDARDMSAVNRRYDQFVCGSDQIWSVFDVNFNGFYYLDFCTKKKVSYATSLGAEKIPDDKIDQVKKWLNGFSAISIREKQPINQLENILNRDVQLVLDPTLLLGADAWRSFSKGFSSRIKKPYLLCYFLECKPWYYQYAKMLGNYLGLIVLIIPNRVEHLNDVNCYRRAVGPIEFVGLFEKADFVLTDSYHGSIFSIIFSKQFLCIQRFSDQDQYNQNSRIFSLFTLLGLGDIIVPKKDFDSIDIKQIKYVKVRKVLDALVSQSTDFLNKSLESV